MHVAGDHCWTVVGVLSLSSIDLCQSSVKVALLEEMYIF